MGNIVAGVVSTLIIFSVFDMFVFLLNVLKFPVLEKVVPGLLISFLS